MPYTPRVPKSNWRFEEGVHYTVREDGKEFTREGRDKLRLHGWALPIEEAVKLRERESFMSVDAAIAKAEQEFAVEIAAEDQVFARAAGDQAAARAAGETVARERAAKEAEAFQAGVYQERERCKAILNCSEAKGFEKVAAALCATDMAAEKARENLAAIAAIQAREGKQSGRGPRTKDANYGLVTGEDGPLH